jgi:hypothetical protein
MGYLSLQICNINHFYGPNSDLESANRLEIDDKLQVLKF